MAYYLTTNSAVSTPLRRVFKNLHVKVQSLIWSRIRLEHRGTLYSETESNLHSCQWEAAWAHLEKRRSASVPKKTQKNKQTKTNKQNKEGRGDANICRLKKEGRLTAVKLSCRRKTAVLFLKLKKREKEQKERKLTELHNGRLAEKRTCYLNIIFAA